MPSGLWTVPGLPVGVGRLGTAKEDGSSCPQSAHTDRGQVIERKFDLTTAPWITARLDDAVTHTAHNHDDDIFLVFWSRSKEHEWTIFELASNDEPRSSDDRTEGHPCGKCGCCPGPRRAPSSSLEELHVVSVDKLIALPLRIPPCARAKRPDQEHVSMTEETICLMES